MSRIVGLILLLLLVVLLVPPVRERARPYLQPALDPVYEWSAKNRVKTLVKYVEEEEMLGRPIPTPKAFADFIEYRDVQKDASKDPWGNPYYLKVLRRGYYVGSPGRDQTAYTADDITSMTVNRRGDGRRR